MTKTMARVNRKEVAAKYLCLVLFCGLFYWVFGPLNVASQPHSVIVASFTLGSQSKNTELIMESQKSYARRHNYDFIVVKEPFDFNVTLLEKPEELYSMQKLVAFSQAWSHDYDYVVVMDDNIFPTCHAPPIHAVVAVGAPLAMVDEFSQPTVEVRLEVQQNMGWEATAEEYFKLAGFTIKTGRVLNANLIVGQPKYHGSFLENLYYRYYKTAIGHPRKIHFMQAALGYELLSNSSYTVLPNKFNANWFIQNAADPKHEFSTFQKESYFLNFAGVNKMHKLDLDTSCVKMPGSSR